MNRDVYEKQRKPSSRMSQNAEYLPILRDLQKKVNTSETLVRPEQVANLSQELFCQASFSQS